MQGGPKQLTWATMRNPTKQRASIRIFGKQYQPGFYYGWVIVFVIGLAGFTQSAESFPVLGVFLKPITEEFGWSRTVFTGSMTIGTLCGGLIALVVGPLIDRFGARWTLAVAFTILGTTLILMAFIDALWQFYALQIIGRMLTMGVTGLAFSVVVPKWFIQKRGRAVALSGLGQRFGSTVTPLYVQLLVSMGSWRLASAVAGILVWVMSLIPVAIFLRRQPEDMGLLPDGASLDSQNPIDSSESKQPVFATSKEVSFTLRDVLHLRSFYLLVIAFSLVFMAAPALNLHMIPLMTDKGISAGVAVAAVAIMSVGAGVGSLVSGFLAEKFGARLTLVSIFILMAIGYISLLTVQVAWHGIAWSVYYGLSNGGMFILQQVIFADYYGRESLGSIRGVVWPVQMAFNAAGPFLASVVYDVTGDYVVIFSTFAALILISGLLVYLAKPPNGVDV